MSATLQLFAQRGWLRGNDGPVSCWGRGVGQSTVHTARLALHRRPAQRYIIDDDADDGDEDHHKRPLIY